MVSRTDNEVRFRYLKILKEYAQKMIQLPDKPIANKLEQEMPQEPYYLSLKKEKIIPFSCSPQRSDVG